MTDHDTPKYFDFTYPKARKNHACDECFHIIQPGESYRHMRAYDVDSGWYTHKLCIECQEVERAVVGPGIYARLIDEAGYFLPIDRLDDGPTESNVRAWVEKWESDYSERRKADLTVEAGGLQL